MNRLILLTLAMGALASVAVAQWNGGGPAGRTYTFSATNAQTITFFGGSGWIGGNNTISVDTVININKYAYVQGALGSNVVLKGYDTTIGQDSGSVAYIAFNSSMDVTFSGFDDPSTAANATYGDPANVKLKLTTDYDYMVKSFGGSDTAFSQVTKGTGTTFTILPGDYNGLVAELRLRRTIKPALNNPAATYNSGGTVTFTLN